MFGVSLSLRTSALMELGWLACGLEPMSLSLLLLWRGEDVVNVRVGIGIDVGRMDGRSLVGRFGR